MCTPYLANHDLILSLREVSIQIMDEKIFLKYVRLRIVPWWAMRDIGDRILAKFTKIDGAYEHE